MKAILAPPAEAVAPELAAEEAAELAGLAMTAELAATAELAETEDPAALDAAEVELDADGLAVDELLQADATKAIVTVQIPRPIARLLVERSDRMSSPCGHEGWEVVGLGDRSPDWQKLTTLHDDRQGILGAGSRADGEDQVLDGQLEGCPAR